MKRSSVVAIVVAAVLVLGVVGAVAVAALSGGDDTPGAIATSAAPVDTGDGAVSDGPRASDTPGSPSGDPSDSSTAGAYVDYSEAALASAEGQRVLFFHATWCPRCRALEADILANGVPDGVTILKVDYDSNQALRQQYDVRQQTTVVLLDDREQGVASFVAYEEPTVSAALAGLGIGG